MPDSTQERERLASFLMTLRGGEGVAGRLMEAVEAVPRRLFVPGGVADPFADQSFPLPCGQTMPSARMAVRLVSALKVQPESRVLEIGTGSGYVTALLARLGLHVTTLERYTTLLTQASERLAGLALTNVTFVREDGRDGLAAQAPFDRILVHGSFEAVPRSFVEQMAPQGIMLVALGPGDEAQMMTRQQRLGSRFEEEALFPVRLQPLEKGVSSSL